VAVSYEGDGEVGRPRYRAAHLLPKSLNRVIRYGVGSRYEPP